MEINYLKDKSIIDEWNKKPNNFNCPHFFEKQTPKFETDPCSFCAHPECPKHQRIMC